MSDSPPYSEDSIESYIEDVLRDNFIPGPDNTRAEPYKSSARAIRMSVLSRMQSAPSPGYWRGIVASHIETIRVSVGDAQSRKVAYHAALSAYIGMGMDDVFDEIKVRSDMVLVGLLDDLDLLKVEHLDAALADGERAILNWGIGNGRIEPFAKAFVLMTQKRRQLLLKEETSGDE